MEPSYCFTLDLEEDHAGIIKGSFEGLEHLPEILEKCEVKGIASTIFVQTKLLDLFPDEMRILKDYRIEVEPHSYEHSYFRRKDDWEDILKAKKVYEGYFSRPPLGYRFPLGNITDTDYEFLHKNGFCYDSSIFPSYRPGQFNNSKKPTTPYKIQRVWEIPIGVISDLIRVPIGLSYIKLLHPFHSLMVGKSQGPIVIDSHLHDIFKLNVTKSLRIFDRMAYTRKSGSGLPILFDYLDRLHDAGYASKNLNDIYCCLTTQPST